MQIKTSALIELATAFCNLQYETLFIADIQKNSLIFVANTSYLMRNTLKDKIEGLTLSSLIETLSGEDNNFFRILEVIKSHFFAQTDVDRKYWVYMTDMKFLLNGDKSSLICVKITPFLHDSNGCLRYIVLSVGFSSGIYQQKILALQTHTGLRKVFDLKTKTWSSEEYGNLTAVELSVLALSAEGMSVQEIAGSLHRSPDTIKSIRRRIFAKLRVDNIVHALISAFNNKII